MRLRRYALLLLVLAACLGLLTLQSRGAGTGRVADFVSVVITPFQLVVAKTHRATVAVWQTYRDWKYAREEAITLRGDNERLRVQALEVAEVREENRRLRRALELRERLPLSTLVGEVIGREGTGWVRSLTINRGLGDGLGTQTPVIVPEGLVGRVVRVRPGVAIVQLLNDPTSAVGAVVQRSRTVGIVEGEPGGAIRFKFMARDSGVQRGDVIVTSGQGSVFPKGLPVGQVASVEDKGSALFHYAVLTPVADFARLEEVLLLTGRTERDLASVFGLGG